MKKRTKIFIGAVSTFAIATNAIALSSCYSRANKNEINTKSLAKTENGYVYDNKYFQSMDQLVDYFIYKNPNIISNDFYFGDLSKATLDQTTGLVNIDQLKPYVDESRLKPVYLNVLGKPTFNFEEAKKSYINPGQIAYKYYDFNNGIFNSYEEAKQSIINSNNSIGTQFYNIDLNNDYQEDKFNPLSKLDLLTFKQKVYNQIVNNFKTNRTTDFSLKLYDDKSLNNNQVVQTSEYSDIVFDKEFIHKIIKKSIENYFISKLDVLRNDYRYEVKVTNFNDGDNLNYKFVNFESSDNNSYLSDDKRTITFRRVEFDKLKEFSAFVNVDDFYSKFDTSKDNYKWGLEVVAQQAQTRDNDKFLNATFEIKYNGYSKGSGNFANYEPWIKILKPGRGEYGVRFLVEITPIQIQNIDYKKMIFDKYQNKQNSITSSLNKQSIVYKIINNISNQVLINLINLDNGINKLSYLPDFVNKIEIRSEQIKNLNTELVSKNDFLKDGFNSDRNNKFIPKDNMFKEGILKGYSYGNEIIDLQKTQNFIIENLKNKNFVIEFNNSPLFKFKLDFLSDEIKKNNIVEQKNDKDYNKKIVLFNLKNFLQQTYFNEEITKISKMPTNHTINKFKNASQSFYNLNNSNVNYLFDNVNLIKTNPSNPLEIQFDYKNDFNNKLIQQDELVVPTIDINRQYPINSIINTYSKITDFIKRTYVSNYQEVINKELVKPEDIVLLYNKQRSLISTSYREFLSNGKYVCANLIDNNSIGLYNSRQEIINAIEANKFVNPAKIVVIYDLASSNVMNPGIISSAQLSETEELLTTSDAIFDSERNIIDNLFRTKLVPQDTTKRYYLENDGTWSKEPIEYKLNQVYKLKLDNKIYYYRSHFDIINALENYLELHSERA